MTDKKRELLYSRKYNKGYKSDLHCWRLILIYIYAIVIPYRNKETIHTCVHIHPYMNAYIIHLSLSGWVLHAQEDMKISALHAFSHGDATPG